MRIIDDNNAIESRRWEESILTSFGEVAVAEPTPIVQLQFAYNINEKLATTRLNGGSASVSGGLLSLSTGASANREATLLSHRPIKYSSGEGGKVMFTALYTTGAADSTQWLGIGTPSDGFFFGFNGTAFSILRRQGGAPETRILTVSTKSSTAEDITITLNSDALATVAVTDGADTTVTANEIAAADYSGVGPGWVAHSMGSTVIFTSFEASAQGGTYTLSSASTAVGTFALGVTGATPTETVVALADWSEGSLPFTLDPTKGNVFMIQYQWLGFGMITYLIENPDTGRFIPVHKIKYANSAVIPSLNNPSLPLCAVVKNAANTSDIVLKSSSMAGFTEGKIESHVPPSSISANKAAIGTSETPVLSIHNHTIYQGVLNRVEVDILALSISVDGTKPAIVRIRHNPTLVGASFSDIDANTTVLRSDNSATSASGGEAIEFTLSKEQSIIIGKDVLEKIHLEVGETFTVSIEATNGTTDARVTILYEDFF